MHNQIVGLTRQHMFRRKLFSTLAGGGSPDVGGNVDEAGPNGHAGEKQAEDTEGGVGDADAK